MKILTLPQRTSRGPSLGAGHVTVLVITGARRFADLDRHLPDDWQVQHRSSLDPGGGPDPDIVVLDGVGFPAAPRVVTAACLRHPTAAVVAVIGPYSDHEEVVDVLEAGADACVRSGTTA